MCKFFHINMRPGISIVRKWFKDVSLQFPSLPCTSFLGTCNKFPLPSWPPFLLCITFLLFCMHSNQSSLRPLLPYSHLFKIFLPLFFSILPAYLLRHTVNLGLVSMNYIFHERNWIYLHGEDKVRC